MKHNGGSRRAFLGAAAALAAGTALPAIFVRALSRPDNPGGEENDDEICRTILARARARNLAALPMGELVAQIGSTLTDRPYRAGTLEEPGDEHLVVNLREFDCVTFVESSFALARTVKAGDTDAAGFKKQLQLLRYRGGVINGYPSRLHYFTDWIFDNAARKNVTDITMKTGGVIDPRPINFMTGHRDSYPPLAREEVFRTIARTETVLTSRARYVLPRAKVASALPFLRSGDIVGVMTSTEGLDCSHTGLVAVNDGVTRFLHAPLSGGHVQFSRGSLAEYIQEHASRTGIVVARPLAPAAGSPEH